jgi:CTP synthase
VGVTNNPDTKYIFVTGGVISGLGKGITAASLGTLLKSRGFSINLQKCDPYLNFDAGTLNPGEHGEVFVTDDGMETDLDLGHYERFIDRNLTKESSLMSGQIYARVLEAERAGRYLGKTIQIIPHITDAVQQAFRKSAQGSEIHIVEIGGTIGDIESSHFIEGIRQFRTKVGAPNVLIVHVVFLPYLDTSDEIKTKPAQNSVRELRNLGLTPDILIARAEKPFSQTLIDKLALFCDVPAEAIVPMPTARTVYEVPLTLEKAGIDAYVVKRLGLRKSERDMDEWGKLVKKILAPKPKIRVGMVAKYLANQDTYLSVNESVKAAAWANGYEAEIVWVDSEKLEKGADLLSDLDGILVPGGFGDRGVEGMILSANYARERKVPYLGLCLGMQIQVIEFARHAANLYGANSTEMDEETPHPVIDLMEEQKEIFLKGGTMRLGGYPCHLEAGTLTQQIYGKTDIRERHRHRYEFNNNYREQLEKAGLVISGVFPEGNLVEIVELPGHPFMVGVQFHPEFLSRPQRPHPLFNAFVQAAIKHSQPTKAKAKSAQRSK